MLEELLAVVKDKATVIADSMGYEIVEVNFSKEYRRLNLNFFIYKKGGVDLNDCENFHNALDSLLEELSDKFPDDYVLNVSSPGLDRPILSDDDFRRALDTEIEVFVKGDNKEAVRGKLTAYDAQIVTVSENKKGQIKQINILRQNIQKAQPWIKF